MIDDVQRKVHATLYEGIKSTSKQAKAVDISQPKDMRRRYLHFSSSDSFRVVLPNLNHGTGREVSGSESGETVKSHETSSGTINETIHETIKTRPGISRAELVALVGRSRSTVARAVAELIGTGKIERRGSKKTGGYFAKDA